MVPQSLIGWNDQTHSYDYYNLIFDVPVEGMFRAKTLNANTRTGAATIQDQLPYTYRKNASQRPIFSIIAHYPPEWALKLRESKEE